MESITLKFIMGIAAGLEIELGDTLHCLRRGKLTLQEFTEAFKYLEQGIEHLNLNDLERGGEALGTALASLPELAKDCGLTKFSDDINNVVKLLKSGVLKFVITETAVIVAHGREIGGDIKATIVQYRAGKYFESGTALGKVLGILLQGAKNKK